MLSAFTPIGGLTQNRALIDVIGDLGLTSGLQLCLDAGDSRSYDGSSQTWTDQSGGGYSFFRGTTSSSEASDPTFNGSAGAQSGNEYFSFDGGDYFTLNQTNPTWVNSLSKDNAIYALAAWGWWGGTSASLYFFNSAPVASSPGMFMRVSSASTQMGVTVYNSGGIALNVAAGAAVSTGAWHFFGLVLNEGAGTGSAILDGTVTSLGSTVYTSPSASNPSQTAQIGAVGTSAFTPSGSRVACEAIWSSTVPTTAQIVSIYTATRGRFGV